MLVGDRDPNVGDGLSALEGRTWDAVFDTTSYIKRTAEASAALLKGHVKRYVNISSVSVYSAQGQHGLTESDPVATIEDESTEDVGAAYGALKAICERTFTETFGEGTTNIRPGFIVGPDDYMMIRFPLWCARIKRGGELIAPGDPNDPVQLIDVRDLADFSLRCIEENIGGDFNLVGPASKLPTDEFCFGLGACVSPAPKWAWVSAAFLEEKGLIPVPWVPSSNAEYGGLASVSNAKAINAGLTFRPLAQTTLDTMAWMDGLSPEQMKPIEDFFAAGTEQALLDEWKAQQAG
jgi:2'-hydroxyisoflavone reductase